LDSLQLVLVTVDIDHPETPLRVESPLRPRGSGSGAGQQRTTAGVAEIVGGWIVEVACKTVAAINRRSKCYARMRMLIDEFY
jgi:hypothetical protein